MFCPTCGKDSAVDAKFCENCGTVLPDDRTAQASSQQQATPPPPPPYTQPQYGQPNNQNIYSAIPLKSGGLAAVLAFLWPGLGHIYLGLLTKGLFYLLLYIILWIMVPVIAIITLGIGFIFVLVPLIFWIWQIFDAYKLANQYNLAVQQAGQAPW